MGKITQITLWLTLLGVLLSGGGFYLSLKPGGGGKTSSAELQKLEGEIKVLSTEVHGMRKEIESLREDVSRLQPGPTPIPVHTSAPKFEWSIQLTGVRIVTPMDVYSSGTMNGIAVALHGDPIVVRGYGSLERVQFETQVAHNQGWSPHHLAPIDYDQDGKFDELLVVSSGSTTKPGTINFGPEAQVFGFLILDNNGDQLWKYQCAHFTRFFIGATLSGPRCSAEEANSIYREKLTQYGYNFDGRFIDETFQRVDVDGEFGGSIRVLNDRIEVR